MRLPLKKHYLYVLWPLTKWAIELLMDGNKNYEEIKGICRRKNITMHIGMRLFFHKCAYKFITALLPLFIFVYQMDCSCILAKCRLSWLNVKPMFLETWKSKNCFGNIEFFKGKVLSWNEKEKDRASSICEIICLTKICIKCAETKRRLSWMSNVVTWCGRRSLHQMRVELQLVSLSWTVYI